MREELSLGQDQFETENHRDERDFYLDIRSAKEMMGRFYNPRLQTELSKSMQGAVGVALRENQEGLKVLCRSEDIAVHMSGSALLGVATKGKENTEEGYKNRTNLPKSDLDIVVFVGEESPELNREFSELVEKDPRFPYAEYEEFATRNRLRDDILKESGFWGDSHIVNVPRLQQRLSIISQKISDGERVDENEKWIIFDAMLLFASNNIFQTQADSEARFRNGVLKIIVGSPGGRGLWETMRAYFDNYYIRYEEGRGLVDFDKWKHKHRVLQARKEVFDEREVPPERRERAANYLKSRQTSVQLSSFQDLLTIKDKLR